MPMLGIPELQKIAATRHCLDKYESRVRTQHIRMLRCMWSNASYLGTEMATVKVRDQIDESLMMLGAEPEGVRRDRHYTIWEKGDPKSMDDIFKVDYEIGHQLYLAWLGGYGEEPYRGGN